MTQMSRLSKDLLLGNPGLSIAEKARIQSAVKKLVSHAPELSTHVNLPAGTVTRTAYIDECEPLYSKGEIVDFVLMLSIESVRSSGGHLLEDFTPVGTITITAIEAGEWGEFKPCEF